MADLYTCKIFLSLEMDEYTDMNAEADFAVFDEFKVKLQELNFAINSAEEFPLGTRVGDEITLDDKDIIEAVRSRIPDGYEVGGVKRNEYWKWEEPLPPYMEWYSVFPILKDGAPVSIGSGTFSTRSGTLIAVVSFKIAE